MASASMPSNSGITPIFSDEEAKTINDYFQNLFRKQHLNLWSTKKTQNYLTITDLDFLHSFILKNIIDIEIKDITEQEKIKKDKFYDFFLFFDNIIKSYKVNILNEKINNNNKNNSKITILNNNSETDLISIINSTISILIEKFILNPEYFNQKDLSITLSGKSFIFMKNDKLKSILDNIDSKRFLSRARASMEISGQQHVATQEAIKASQEAEQEKVRQIKQTNKNILKRFAAVRGGMRKTTKNKTTKTIKHKTTKNKTTKNKTNKNKTTKNKTTKNKTIKKKN